MQLTGGRPLRCQKDWVAPQREAARLCPPCGRTNKSVLYNQTLMNCDINWRVAVWWRYCTSGFQADPGRPGTGSWAATRRVGLWETPWTHLQAQTGCWAAGLRQDQQQHSVKGAQQENNTMTLNYATAGSEDLTENTHLCQNTIVNILEQLLSLFTDGGLMLQQTQLKPTVSTFSSDWPQ